MDENKLQNLISDFNLSLNKTSHDQFIKVQEEIINFAKNGCHDISDEQLKFTIYTASTIYFRLTESFEKTLSEFSTQLIKELNSDK